MDFWRKEKKHWVAIILFENSIISLFEQGTRNSRRIISDNGLFPQLRHHQIVFQFGNFVVVSGSVAVLLLHLWLRLDRHLSHSARYTTLESDSNLDIDSNPHFFCFLPTFSLSHYISHFLSFLFIGNLHHAHLLLTETENRTLEDIESHFSDNSKKLTDRKIAKAVFASKGEAANGNESHVQDNKSNKVLNGVNGSGSDNKGFISEV